MKKSPFDTATLEQIFKFDPDNEQRLASRESGRLEFKESFSLGNADDYAKTMAAFANTAGGYLVFGVKDKPREVVGLKTDHFETVDSAKVTQALNERLAPEIEWEMAVHPVKGKKVGVLFVNEAGRKPVICQRSSKELQEGAIYYRYRGRSEKIKFAELRQLLDSEREKEREMWMQTLSRMARIGIENVGVLNSITGEVSGSKGSFLISEDLLPQIQFIHSGMFVESGGHPTLKLIGEVTPINSQFVQPTKLVRRPLHGPDIIKAFLRRESVLSPLDYVKQVCFEPSVFYPMHFFINQTRLSVAEVISEVEKVDCRIKMRNRVVERLTNKGETFTYGNLKTGTPAGKRLNQMFVGLVGRTLTDTEAKSNLVAVFHALTHLARDNGDPEFVLPLLLRVAMPKYSQLPSLDAGYMRKALCHLDVIWYKHNSGKATLASQAAKAG